MACGTPALLSEATAAGVPAVRDSVFTTTLSGEDLHSTTQAALAAIAADDGFRERVAAVARERWFADGMVSRYEEQLEALLH